MTLFLFIFSLGVIGVVIGTVLGFILAVRLGRAVANEPQLAKGIKTAADRIKQPPQGKAVYAPAMTPEEFTAMQKGTDEELQRYMYDELKIEKPQEDHERTG